MGRKLLGTYGSLLKRQESYLISTHTFKPFPFGNDGWKLGATTGARAGYFADYNINVRLTDDMHMGYGRSEEWLFFSHESLPRFEHFTRPGDSGSVLFDGEGGLVGFLFRG